MVRECNWDSIETRASGQWNRLPLARELLTGSGSAFVRISDENVHLVRCFGGSWLDFLGRSRGLCQGSLSPCYWQMIK